MNEKAVEAQDWRLRVFDSLSFPTLILRPDRVIVTANEKLLDKFGVPMKDIVGKTCHEVFYNSKEPCSAYLCPLPGVLAIGEGHSILREVTLSTGEKAWEDRVFSPIKDDAGNIIYVMESLRDVTRIRPSRGRSKRPGNSWKRSSRARRALSLQRI